MKMEPIKLMRFVKPISVGGRTIEALTGYNETYLAAMRAFPWVTVWQASNPAIQTVTTIFNVLDRAPGPDVLTADEPPPPKPGK
jgi:hypothetical protein